MGIERRLGKAESQVIRLKTEERWASEEGEGKKRHKKGVDHVEQTNPGATRYEMTKRLGSVRQVSRDGCGIESRVDVKFG